MIHVDTAWEHFNKHSYAQRKVNKNKKLNLLFPKCSEIYISTKTKIAYLNQDIDLSAIFWEIPSLQYQERKEGVLKKQMKINCLCDTDVEELEKKIDIIKKTDTCINVDILKQVKEGRKTKFKDTRKVNIGLNAKDLITFRKKKKGAFYNCFVLILRIWTGITFKEIHVKVFNTGKLEIPGIRDENLLLKALDLIIKILQPYKEKLLCYKPESIQTVLINSNFSCNYYINREKLCSILKYKYYINVIFDSCSYPGIQCKFYYNKNNIKHEGICRCKNKCNKKGSGQGEGQCKEISFMIFRTGSVLIVGNCTEKILNIIYIFLKGVFKEEYGEIAIEGDVNKAPKKKKRVRKKKIFIVNKSN